MKLNVIRDALRYYAMSADCPDKDRAAVFDAIEEVAQTADRYYSHDTWADDVVVIPTPALIDMLNEMTYDDYGRRAKTHGDGMRFEYYAHDVRNKHSFDLELLTDQQLMAGYEVINDLWHDNEEQGANDTDGSFRRHD